MLRVQYVFDVQCGFNGQWYIVLQHSVICDTMWQCDGVTQCSSVTRGYMSYVQCVFSVQYNKCIVSWHNVACGSVTV